jgi:tryptophan synthase beta chain
MPDDILNSFMTGPDEKGRFGDFGGRFVSETLMPLILELEAQYENAKTDQSFWDEMDDLWTNYVGRPSPLYFAERLTDRLGGAKIYFKRDELNHTGAHKINNVLGQIILARRMGKTRIIAETGAGQHGVATATVCAKFGLKCIVYMGATDVERQAPERLPDEAAGRGGGAGHLRARHAEGRDERRAARLGHQCARHVLLHRHGRGPHPYPAMVRDFQAIIGKETKEPDHGRRGPSARHDHRRHRRRVERDGPVLPVPRRHRGGHHRRRGRRQGRERQDGALRLADRRAPRACCMATAPTCCRTRTARSSKALDLRRSRLSRASGRSMRGCTISAGPIRLDHRHRGAGGVPAVLRDRGHHPALEPSHALAHVAKIAPDLPSDHLIVMNMCGRGDKDIFTVARALGWDMAG